MIRPFRAGDLQPVLQIWLDSNTTAHSFISPSYWQDRRELVLRPCPMPTCTYTSWRGPSWVSSACRAMKWKGCLSQKAGGRAVSAKPSWIM